MKLITAVALGLAVTTSAFAQDENTMIDECRQFAADHLGVDPGIINLRSEGVRTDGTRPFNGEVEGTDITFQCSFDSDGGDIVEWVTNDESAGCPVDVSEADRYRYPACN